MSTIVLVHGIAQEQLSADSLENNWLPALAGGVRNSGHPDLADRLWRGARAGDIDVRLAYFGDLFLRGGAQGSAGSSQADLDDDSEELVELLAIAWLKNAATHANDSHDRNEAVRQLASLNGYQPGTQGARARIRPAMNGLARLRWFAPFGLGLAGRFVERSLTQVARYLSDDLIRNDAQDRVLSHIGSETRLVIGHSLGSVVAYEALHRTEHPVALLTLGSPLGLRNIIYERLRPQPSHVPRSVSRWDNLVDVDDLVAAHLDLAPYFPPGPESTVNPITAPAVDNGSKPHDALHYLTKSITGHIVAESLDQ